MKVNKYIAFHSRESEWRGKIKKKGVVFEKTTPLYRLSVILIIYLKVFLSKQPVLQCHPV